MRKIRHLFLFVLPTCFCLGKDDLKPAWTSQCVAENSNPLNSYSFLCGLAADTNGFCYIYANVRGVNNRLGQTLLPDEQVGTPRILARLNPDGTPQWVQRCGPGPVGSMWIDVNNCLVHAGIFKESTHLGTNQIAAKEGSGSIIAILKFRQDGTLIETKRIEAKSSGFLDLYSIAAGRTGNLAIAGIFSGTLDIAGNHLESTEGGSDFVLSCTATGKLRWIRTIKRAGRGGIVTVSIGPNDELAISGDFYGSRIFGSKEKISRGKSDIFVAKYDSDGQLLWIHQLGGPGIDAAGSLKIDNAGNVFFTGSAMNRAEIDGTPLKSVEPNASHVILYKFDPAGKIAWSHQFGNFGYSGGKGLALASDGRVFITGYCTSPLSIGTTVIKEGRAFVAGFSPNGEAEWAKELNEQAFESRVQITTDKSDAIFLSSAPIASSLPTNGTVLFSVTKLK